MISKLHCGTKKVLSLVKLARHRIGSGALVWTKLQMQYLLDQTMAILFPLELTLTEFMDYTKKGTLIENLWLMWLSSTWLLKLVWRLDAVTTLKRLPFIKIVLQFNYQRRSLFTVYKLMILLTWNTKHTRRSTNGLTALISLSPPIILSSYSRKRFNF